MADMKVKQPKGVKLDHISKIYKDPKTGKDFYAVHDVALDITPGSFVTLLGPSGCGKTTTLRMIAGFESPDEGEIYLGGEPINALTPNKRDTAMVFQSYALFPHYNVFDNVAYGLKLRKVAVRTEKKRTSDETCEIVLRPEAITIGDEGMLPCRVELSCFMGSYQNYHVRVGEELVKITDNCLLNKKIFNTGDRAYISFDPECAHLL